MFTYEIVFEFANGAIETYTVDETGDALGVKRARQAAYRAIDDHAYRTQVVGIAWRKGASGTYRDIDVKFVGPQRGWS
jgi:hypothetical protein